MLGCTCTWATLRQNGMTHAAALATVKREGAAQRMQQCLPWQAARSSTMQRRAASGRAWQAPRPCMCVSHLCHVLQLSRKRGHAVVQGSARRPGAGQYRRRGAASRGRRAKKAGRR
eukprot:359590-Chlamydomonas_euryale.AAC.10